MEGSVKLVQRGDGPIEIRLQGLLTTYERRVRRWRVLFECAVVGLCFVLFVSATAVLVRWDRARTRTLALLGAELEVARVKTLCWETVARNPRPEKFAAVIVDACVTHELIRRNGGSKP